MQIGAGSRRQIPKVGLTMSDSAAVPVGRPFGSGGPTLTDAGEGALLEQLVDLARTAAGHPPVGSAGDDAAVWTPPAGADVAVTVDALVEGVDFRRSWITPRQLGRRCFTVAVSDLAGTGAQPVHCVVTLCARGSERLEDILEIQRGLCEAAGAAGCDVIGGDVSAIDGPLVIDVCVSGRLPGGRALRRRDGRAGDALMVTGVVGRAAAGLRLLIDGAEAVTAMDRAWIDAQLQPQARVREGIELLARGVRCGGDISDGLVLDAARTCRAAGCGADLWAESLPVDPELRTRFGDEWLELACGGGEDFELLIAVPPAEVDALVGAWPGDLAQLSLVGVLREGSGLRVLDRRRGVELPLPATHARHFSRSRP